jgi:hypothetical protein
MNLVDVFEFLQPPTRSIFPKPSARSRVIIIERERFLYGAAVDMDVTHEPPLTEAVHLKVSAPLYKALKRLAEKQDCSINSVA